MAAAGVRDTADIERELTAFAQEPNGGIIVTPSPATNASERRDLIMAMAARLRLPVIYPYHLPAESSGLISYAHDPKAEWQGGAAYVDSYYAAQHPPNFPCRRRPNTKRLSISRSLRRFVSRCARAARTRRRGDRVRAARCPLCQFDCRQANGRNRRVSPVPSRPAETPVTEPIAVASLGIGELVFMPRSRPSSQEMS